MFENQQPDPLCDTEGRCLILDLPPLQDETALQLSHLLQTLSERFEETYLPQILRASHAREQERERRYRERCFRENQQHLPFEEDFPF